MSDTQAETTTYLTVAEAGKLLGISSAGVHYLLSRGKLHKTRGVIGLAILIDAESVTALQASGWKPRTKGSCRA